MAHVCAGEADLIGDDGSKFCLPKTTFDWSSQELWGHPEGPPAPQAVPKLVDEHHQCVHTGCLTACQVRMNVAQAPQVFSVAALTTPCTDNL